MLLYTLIAAMQAVGIGIVCCAAFYLILCLLRIIRNGPD